MSRVSYMGKTPQYVSDAFMETLRLAGECDDAEKAYLEAKRLYAVSKARWQDECKHENKKSHVGSGNNDSYTECLDCGRELT